MFSARSSLVVGGDLDAGTIVFEDATLDFGDRRMKCKATTLEFVEEVHHVDDLMESGGQSNIFGFCGRKSG